MLLVLSASCQQATTSGARSSATPTATVPSQCPAKPAVAGKESILSGLQAPDDLTFDQAGRLIFGDIKAGTVSRVDSAGAVQPVATGLQVPEGIVTQPDGKLLVAEQGRNRIDLVDPSNQSVTPWRTFVNRTGNEGIDGIARDPISGEVIVPDSPNGSVFRVAADGSTARRIAGGMTRPVGAAVDQQGAVLVADEGGVLWRLPAAFQQRRIASFKVPDDVVVDHAGNLFINTLGDGAIHMIGAGGSQLVVADGLRGPQGLALDGADNLYFTESDAGAIGRIVRTFALDRPEVQRSNAGTVVICPTLRRASGYTDPLELSVLPATGLAVANLVQPADDLSGLVEVRRGADAAPFVDIQMRAGLLEIRQRVSLS